VQHARLRDHGDQLPVVVHHQHSTRWIFRPTPRTHRNDV
jgi:hypothetical protein